MKYFSKKNEKSKIFKLLEIISKLEAVSNFYDLPIDLKKELSYKNYYERVDNYLKLNREETKEVSDSNDIRERAILTFSKHFSYLLNSSNENMKTINFYNFLKSSCNFVTYLRNHRTNNQYFSVSEIYLLRKKFILSFNKIDEKLKFDFSFPEKVLKDSNIKTEEMNKKMNELLTFLNQSFHDQSNNIYSDNKLITDITVNLNEKYKLFLFTNYSYLIKTAESNKRKNLL